MWWWWQCQSSSMWVSCCVRLFSGFIVAVIQTICVHTLHTYRPHLLPGHCEWLPYECVTLCMCMCVFQQGGQSSTHTFFSLSHVFVISAECGFTLPCWKMYWHLWKRCCLKGSICCFKISLCLSVLILPSQKCVHICQVHCYKPIPSQSLPFGLVDYNSLYGPFCFWSRTLCVCLFLKRRWILINQTTKNIYCSQKITVSFLFYLIV